jgi:hypothetical protein
MPKARGLTALNGKSAGKSVNVPSQMPTKPSKRLLGLHMRRKSGLTNGVTSLILCVHRQIAPSVVLSWLGLAPLILMRQQSCQAEFLRLRTDRIRPVGIRPMQSRKAGEASGTAVPRDPTNP